MGERMKERFRYKKEMGQHFILDPALVARLAEASGVTKADGVLEIGPGRGLLTAELARRGRKVIAVELDRTLIRDLDVSLALYPNVEIIQDDILRADLPALAKALGEPCRVAANLPYNITTPLLEMLLRQRLPFLTMAIMVQKEVGERMRARPGEEGYGPLSILVDFYAACEEVLEIPAVCFTPPPKVDSSFMMLTMRGAPLFPDVDEALYFRVVRAAFAMRRKTMLNNLMAGFQMPREKAAEVLAAAGVPEAARGERVAPEGFAGIARVIAGMA